MVEDLTGVLLAGGRSRRFGGVDKAGFVVGGRPMIERVHDAVHAVTHRILVSVREPTASLSIELPLIVDRYVDAGPLAGVDAGLAAAGTSWILAVACDLPYLTADVLEVLVDAREEGLEAVVACTPDGRMQPLCACYHVGIRSVVTKHLDEGRRSMYALLDALPHIRPVDVPERALRNVNNPTGLDETPD